MTVMKSSHPSLYETCKHLVIPDGIVKTGWGPVKRKLAQLGIRFDWWQEDISKLILGKDDDGIYVTSEASVCMSIPRQTGKTTMVGGLVVALALLHPGSTVLWTAHVLRTSNMTFAKMRSMVSRAEIAPFVTHKRLANGEGEIGFTNGSKIMFGARDQGFGLGFDNVSIIVFDEAQRLRQTAMDDMIPTTAVAENPLVFLIGTPPRPNDEGDIFRIRRDEALSGNGDGILWVEFGVDDGVETLEWTRETIDWFQVAKANPSFPHRVNKTAIRRLVKNLGSDSASREVYGRWDSEQVDRMIPVDDWSRNLVTADGDRLAESDRIVGDVVACFAVSHDRKQAWIALCGERADETPQVEVAACVAPIEVAGWLEDRRDRIHAVTAQQRGAGMTSELLEQLKSDRTFKVKVEDWGGPDLTAAHGRGLDALRDGTVRTALNDDLEAAVQGAVSKEIGGGLVVDDRNSSSETAPLKAWFGAFGLWTRPKPPKADSAPPSPVPVPSAEKTTGHRTARATSAGVAKMGF